MRKEFQTKSTVLDSVTGQPLFQPVVSSSFVPAQRNPLKKPVSIYLHETPINGHSH